LPLLKFQPSYFKVICYRFTDIQSYYYTIITSSLAQKSLK